MNQERQKRSAHLLLTFIESLSITEFESNQFKTSLPDRLGIRSGKLWELSKYQLYYNGGRFLNNNFNLDLRYLIKNNLIDYSGTSIARVIYLKNL